MENKYFSLLEGNVNKVIVTRMLLCSFILPIPTLVPYLSSYGLSVGDVLLLQALFALAMLLFEVPSGYFADVLGRKGSLLAGSFLAFMGALGYACAESFNGFLAAEMVLGVGFSFVSGADQALVYDSLSELGRTKEFRKVWGRVEAGELMMGAVGAPVGAFISSYSMHLTYLFTAGLMAVMLLIACSFQEPKRQKLIVEHSHWNEMGKVFRFSFFSGGALAWVILFSGFLGAFNQIAFWMYQPYLQQTEVDILCNGWILSAMNLWAAYVARRAHRSERGDALLRRYAEYTLLLAGSYLAMGMLASSITWVVWLGQQTLRGSQLVFVADFINRHARVEYRATIVSLRNFMQQVMYVLSLLVVKSVIDDLGAVQTSTLSGLLVAGIAAVFFTWRPRKG